MTDRRRLGRPFASDEPGLASKARGWFRSFVGAPAYPASAADLREVELLGLRLPLRATVAITVLTLVTWAAAMAAAATPS